MLDFKNHPIESSCSVQQGDPVVSLMFPIALPSITNAYGTKPHKFLNQQYPDDGTSIVTQQEAQKALQVIETDRGKYGFHLTLKKNVLLWLNLVEKGIIYPK